MTPLSLGGAKYFITFRDDATSWTELEPIKRKKDAFEVVKKFFARSEVMHGIKIKALRSDNGGEYTSKEFERFLDSCGCYHEHSAAYSQEQNGVAERVNRTIVGRAKAMLYGAQLPLFLWAEAVKTAVYIMNRTPTRSQSKTPYELWTGKSAQPLIHLQPFGCEVWHHIPKNLRKKWEPNAIKGFLVGYEGRNQYRVYYNHTVHVTRDIDFVPALPPKMPSPPDTLHDILAFQPEENPTIDSKPAKPSKTSALEPMQSDDSMPTIDVLTDEPFDSITLRVPVAHPAPIEPQARTPESESSTSEYSPSRSPTPIKEEQSRRHSSPSNAGTFSTPRFHQDQRQLRSTRHQKPGPSAHSAHAAVAQTIVIDQPQSWGEAMDSP
jgi:hypothetical protein